MPSAETVGSKARMSLAWTWRTRKSRKLAIVVAMIRAVVRAVVMARPLVRGLRRSKNHRSAELMIGSGRDLKAFKSMARLRAQPKVTVAELAEVTSISRTTTVEIRSQ